MTQGSIGYWLQNALTNEFEKRNIAKPVISVVTQVRVDKEDPSFKKPSKPIGPFYTKEEADAEAAKKMALRMWKMLAVATEKLFHHQCLKKLLKKRRFVL